MKKLVLLSTLACSWGCRALDRPRSIFSYQDHLLSVDAWYDGEKHVIHRVDVTQNGSEPIEYLSVDVFEDRDADGLPDCGGYHHSRTGRPDGFSNGFSLGAIPVPDPEHMVVEVRAKVAGGKEVFARPSLLNR